MGKEAYRADIDGLRCFAVVPVILYHFGIAGFSGGYVGVDIFFVISGYLITGIIHSEIVRGDFSILRFYERRVRRILPALFAMLAVTLATGFWLLLPNDGKSLAESVIWTVLFVSNIGFWKETGYFDALASTKPLLHTWSLAVEEQFYLVFPLLLMLLRRASRWLVLAVLACVTLGSLVIAVKLVPVHPSLVFFWGPTRAWELGIGGLLAVARLPSLPRPWREALAALGLLMIAVAVSSFSNNRPPYMLNLLVPCLGTAFVLQAGSVGPTLAGRLLSWKPFVFLGLISYSLYLWHWPIYVYSLYVSPDGLPPYEVVALLALCLAVAFGSWRFIERPFRGKSGLFQRSPLFQAAGAAAALLIVLSAALYANGGFPQRLPTEIQRLLAVQVDEKPAICTTADLAKLRANNLCAFGSMESGAPQFVLWGDSHAGAIEPGLDNWGRRHRFQGLLAEHPGCVPLIGVQIVPEGNCTAINDVVLEKILASKARVVVLDGLWGLAAERKIAAAPQTPWILTDALSANELDDNNHGAFARGLDRTVRRLTEAGKHVVIIGGVPEVQWSVPEMLAKIRRFGWKTDIRPARKAFLDRQAFASAQFENMKRRYGADVVYPGDVLCASDKCDVEKQGKSLYFDYHHLSVFGANLVTSTLDGRLSAAIGGR